MITHPEFTHALRGRGWSNPGKECWQSPLAPGLPECENSLLIVRWCLPKIWTPENLARLRQSTHELMVSLGAKQ